jgi:hypothetical protein
VPSQLRAKPSFFIFAGPNGSGKATAYTETDIQSVGQSVWIINPDRLAARIADIEQMALPEANLEAVQRIEAWLDASIAAHQSIGVETVLSTGKYRRLVAKAKKLRFEIKLVSAAVAMVRRPGQPTLDLRQFRREPETYRRQAPRTHSTLSRSERRTRTGSDLEACSRTRLER